MKEINRRWNRVNDLPDKVGVGIDTNSGAASASMQYCPGSKSQRIWALKTLIKE